MSVALYADASFLIALLDPSDQWHEKAVALLDAVDADRPVHTHALMLAEVVALVASRHGGKTARTVYEHICDDVELHCPSKQELDDAMAVVVRVDGGLSLSDGLAVVLMRRAGIASILSFDADFDRAGVARRWDA